MHRDSANCLGMQDAAAAWGIAGLVTIVIAREGERPVGTHPGHLGLKPYGSDVWVCKVDGHAVENAARRRKGEAM